MQLTSQLVGWSRKLKSALAGFLVGLAFSAAGITPTHHQVRILSSHPEWNYTTFLDFAAVLLMLVLGYRFLTTGGLEMLRAMEMSPEEHARMTVDPICGMTVDPMTAEQAASTWIQNPLWK